MNTNDNNNTNDVNTNNSNKHMSGVNRGQREHKGSFRGCPTEKVVLGWCQGSC